MDENATVKPHSAPVHLIIGATGGVGSDLARRLHQTGAKLILAGRDEAVLADMAQELKGDYVLCDATSMSQMRDCIESALVIHGRLDGVANCVGSVLLKPAHLTTEEEWNNVIATNLTSAFATVKHAAKAMMGKGGSIVLVSSCAAKVGLTNHEAIAAAKAGVEGLVRSAAATYSRHQIRVNCVAPGLLRTKMTKAITSNETQLQASLDMHPISRVGEASDVSTVMEWLIGQGSSWVTGQSISVDGGIAAVRTARVQRPAASAGAH